MYLRYRTEDPVSVWYDDVDVVLPYDIERAKTVLKERCRRFFGLQYYRYQSLRINLMRGAESLIDIQLSPQEEATGAQFEKDSEVDPLAA